LTGPGPVFRFVHFSVPHFPFAFDADGYDPPVDALRTEPDANYVRQLRFVDTLFGRLVEDMKQLRTYDTTTIVLLADHGFRFGGRERDPLHIPFVVKRPGQVSREVVTARLAGEQLLKRTVEDSCRPL
jgi:arylsulfatase A-like enzyme